MGIFWGVGKISNIVWGKPDTPDMFLGETVVAGPKPKYQENVRISPWGLCCGWRRLLVFSFSKEEFCKKMYFHIIYSLEIH